MLRIPHMFAICIFAIPPDRRMRPICEIAHRASLRLRCWSTLYEYTKSNWQSRKGRNRPSATRYLMSRLNRFATRLAAITAPSDGSMPTTENPFRAAAMLQRPQLHPISNNELFGWDGINSIDGIG